MFNSRKEGTFLSRVQNNLAHQFLYFHSLFFPFFGGGVTRRFFLCTCPATLFYFARQPPLHSFASRAPSISTPIAISPLFYSPAHHQPSIIALAKVKNLVPIVVPFFHYNETYRNLRFGIPGSYRFEFKKNKNIKVQKFEILFKFAYIGRYLTENTGTVRYLAVQTGKGRYLTGTISDINAYRFLTGTVRYRPVRYGIYNYGISCPSSSSSSPFFCLTLSLSFL